MHTYIHKHIHKRARTQIPTWRQLYIYIYMYVFMYVCMSVCNYVIMCVCMFVCLSFCPYICIYNIDSITLLVLQGGVRRTAGAAGFRAESRHSAGRPAPVTFEVQARCPSCHVAGRHLSCQVRAFGETDAAPFACSRTCADAGHALPPAFGQRPCMQSWVHRTSHRRDGLLS